MNLNYNYKKSIIEKIEQLNEEESEIIKNIIKELEIINNYIDELNKKKTA